MSYLVLISWVGVVVGLFVFLRPDRTIRIQQKFYASINWRMEPISMSKEIRNTRIMGVFLAVVSLAAIGLLIFRAV